MAEENELPREGLRKARENLGLSQDELAKLVGVATKEVRRWEQGKADPYRYHRTKLAEHLGVTPEELEALLANTQEPPLQTQNQEQQTPRRWMMPYQRNPYFIGRDEVLESLHATFFSESAAITQQALIGQPGIGKTQIAIEYAYRYCEAYQAILWTTAETADALISDFVRIASLLQLPEKDNPARQLVVEGVKQWLGSTSGWLLIIDNVDDPNLLDGFLPHEGQGHILLTGRDQEVGTRTTTLSVKKMGEEDGATLLLRRAKLIPEQGGLDEARENDREQAREIAEEMDGHPLALDQAGAYIAEARCTLHAYFELYQKYRDKLLHERGRRHFGHPYSLAATILLSFERVKQVNPVAANLLRMCAFLHSDDIPEEFFTVDNPRPGSPYDPVAANDFLLRGAIRELVKYSSVQYRLESRTVSLHRLVQAVLKDQMNDDMQCYWAEYVVWILARTLSRLELGAWNEYQRYISHAIVCIEHIDRWEIFHASTVCFITFVGAYLCEIASYSQAEPICLRALHLAQEILEPENDFTIMSLNNVAMLYERWGNYEKAEYYYLEAVVASLQKPDPITLAIADIFNNLARLDLLRGEYSDAELFAEQALIIRKDLSGPNAPEVADSLGMLAEIYSNQREYQLAEPLLQQALAIREREQEADPLGLALTLNSFIGFYTIQGRHNEAKPYCQRVLQITERERGPKHPDVAIICNNIAEVYRHLGEVSQAEDHCKRALAIFEEVYGPRSVQMIPTLSILAATYQKQGRLSEAEILYKRALALTEEMLGPEHPDMDSGLTGYASLLREMGRFDEAEALDEKALHIKRL